MQILKAFKAERNIQYNKNMEKYFFGNKNNGWDDDVISGTVDTDDLDKIVAIYKSLSDVEDSEAMRLEDEIDKIANSMPFYVWPSELLERDYNKFILTEDLELGVGDTVEEAKLNFCELMSKF